jgi:uncharacterized protein involved in type VI secretion and phage assembly
MKSITSLIAAGALLALAGCGGGGGGGGVSGVSGTSSTYTNTAPVANAGNTQSLMTGATITLDGSNSTDADHDTLTYNWTLTFKPLGSTAALSSSKMVNPTFIADLPGTYIAILVVNDGKTGSNTATVTITASRSNAAPVANAGVAQSVVTGTRVTLDGSASSDANGDALTYNWSLTSPTGSMAVLFSSSTSARPTFTADVAGTYVASLTVNDGQVSSNTATVSITASRTNAAPVANAGTAQSVVAGNSVTLDGSASSDANGDALTYSWSLTSKPTGSTATLSSATSARPTFTADVAGTYVASLSVNDGQVSSNMATVNVSASRTNAAPIANAGTAQSVVAGSTVTLDGSTSSDANGDTLTYYWSLTSRPAGSSATLSSTTAVRPTFTADLSGNYVASLTVNDGQASSNTATVNVSASRTNAAPIANAGTAQSVVAGSTVTLDGSTSSDANGDTLTYYWSLTSRPAGSSATLSSTTAVRPTFTADLSGNYVASLTVNDGQASSNTATVNVSASRANAAPIANAGVSQSAYLGDLVTLDGSASSDANGDALTYVWTTRSHPSFFPPTINGSNTARPTFSSRDAGTYVFSLVVNDGLTSSAASTVSVNIANGVGPTPAGSGLVLQNVSNFWTLDETTMTKRSDFNCNEWLKAIDRRPDGVLVGTSMSQLYEINPISGVCSARGSTPEVIRAIAVSASGQIFGMSESQMQRPDGSGVAHRLHKLTSSGATQSFVYLSGVTNYVNSIDVGPDGQLYGMGITSGGGWSVVKIDTETGVTTIAFSMPVSPTLGDIDIDASGVLRTLIDGTLYKFNINTGALITSTRVPNFPMGTSFAPIVYIP